MHLTPVDTRCACEVRGAWTFHVYDCPVLHREPELLGPDECGCPVYYVGTDDGEPVLITSHTDCTADVTPLPTAIWN